ncbi:MAG: polysaccharide deacetylase [Hyphomicrobiales bacterium]
MELNKRFGYSASIDRPPLSLSGNNRLIVWPIVVLESWDIRRPMPRQIVPPPAAQPVPDYLNWSWHEYGMRVAFWRIAELFKSHGIVPSASINSAVCAHYPRIADYCLNNGWEFLAHGVTQKPVHENPDEFAMIRQCLSEIESYTGRKPRGWASPGISQNEDSVDKLVRAGIEYACDWVFDDEPVELKSPHGQLLAIPYTVDLNDVPVIAIHRQTIQHYKSNIVDTFDRLYAESERSAKIMTIVLHGYICGTPGRIRYIEEAFEHMRKPGVAFWTGDQILDWFRASAPDMAAAGR